MNKAYILCVAAVVGLLALPSCDDDKMDSWGRPGEWGEVSPEDLPVELTEALSRYGAIKSYLGERGLPEGFQIGLGVGAAQLSDPKDPTRRDLAVENFNCITFGNAMKMDATISTKGELQGTATIDAALTAVPDMPVYGHCFIWHTQQQSTWLKGLIAPKVEYPKEDDFPGVNEVTNGDFEVDLAGWNGWGNDSQRAQSDDGQGHGGKGKCLVLTNPSEGADYYVAQAVYTLDQPMELGVDYYYSLWVKAADAGASIQLIWQDASGSPQGGYSKKDVGTEWTHIEGKMNVPAETAVKDGIKRFMINFGKVPTTFYVDDVKFGKYDESLLPPAGPRNEVGTPDFGEAEAKWTTPNVGGGITLEVCADAPSGAEKVIVAKAIVTDNQNDWDLQFASPNMPIAAVPEGAKIMLSFYVKSDVAGFGRVSLPGCANAYPYMDWTGSQSSWTKGFETSDQWLKIEVQVDKYCKKSDAADPDSPWEEGKENWALNFDFGTIPGVTYYFDDIKVNYIVEDGGTKSLRVKGLKASAGPTYTFKTAEEKAAAMTTAMETRIKLLSEYMSDKWPGRVVAWDVINEATTGAGWRGIDGKGYDNTGGDNPEQEVPLTEDETGQHCNWASGHWYWGQFLGKEYARLAFKYARQYNPDAKLFINDYNLESDPAKLDQYIQFAQYIDEGGVKVDGLGTQMHISINPKSDGSWSEADQKLLDGMTEMFKKLASTGKLVRITELDICDGGKGSPTAAQQTAQMNMYREVFNRYFENVPKEQQYGICIWSLSDAADEHEYWLKGETPNLFDAKFQRKLAYKGVCDGLAGRIISDEFKSTVYK